MAISLDELDKSLLHKEIDFGSNPIKVCVSHLKEHPIHFHSHLEIVYAIRGSVTVKSGTDMFTIIEGEYIFLNAYELHALWGTSNDAVIACIHVKLESGGELPLLVYDIETFKKDADMYKNVSGKIQEILRKSLEANGNNEKYHANLIDYLWGNLRHAKYKLRAEKNVYEKDETNLDRLSNVIDYMYLHYDEKLSLEVMANNLHLSRYHLAHVLKKGYDHSFQEVLNLVRAERSELLLLESNKSISQIAFDVGASSQNYYSKFFKEQFGLTPMQHRKKYQMDTVLHKVFDEEICDSREIKEFLFGNDKKKSQKDNKISVLFNSEIAIHAIEECDGIISHDYMNSREGNNIEINFNGNQLILVINKAKSE